MDGPSHENGVPRDYGTGRAKVSESSPAANGQVEGEVQHGLVEGHGWGEQ